MSSRDLASLLLRLAGLLVCIGGLRSVDSAMMLAGFASQGAHVSAVERAAAWGIAVLAVLVSIGLGIALWRGSRYIAKRWLLPTGEVDSGPDPQPHPAQTIAMAIFGWFFLVAALRGVGISLLQFLMQPDVSAFLFYTTWRDFIGSVAIPLTIGIVLLFQKDTVAVLRFGGARAIKRTIAATRKLALMR
jgi:hypothetical protein